MIFEDDSTASEKAALALGAIAFCVLAIVWSAFWSGLALSVLWGWFVVPAFGLPSLNLAMAYGLVLVALAMQRPPQASKSDGKPSDALVKSFVASPFVAGMLMLSGWVTKAFI